MEDNYDTNRIETEHMQNRLPSSGVAANVPCESRRNDDDGFMPLSIYDLGCRQIYGSEETMRKR